MLELGLELLGAVARAELDNGASHALGDALELAWNAVVSIMQGLTRRGKKARDQVNKYERGVQANEDERKGETESGNGSDRDPKKVIKRKSCSLADVTPHTSKKAQGHRRRRWS
jgi:hypothetical protein